MALFNFLCQGWWYLLFWLIVYRCSICGESFIKTPWRKAHTQEAPIGIDGPLLGCTTSSVVGVLVYSSNAQMCLHDSFSVWGKTWPHIPPLPPPNPSVLLDRSYSGTSCHLKLPHLSILFPNSTVILVGCYLNVWVHLTWNYFTPRLTYQGSKALIVWCAEDIETALCAKTNW